MKYIAHNCYTLNHNNINNVKWHLSNFHNTILLLNVFQNFLIGNFDSGVGVPACC